MLQVVTTAANTARTRQVDAPRPRRGESLVRVDMVGLCGSDYHLFDGTHPYARFPIVQGHEITGTVLESAPDDHASDRVLREPVNDGDRVAVEPLLACGECFACGRGRTNCCERLTVLGVHQDGGLSEIMAVPTRLLHAVGDLPPRVAVLCEPLSIGIHAVARAAVGDGDDVLVIGAGPIGLAATLAATDLGAHVTVTDRIPHRLELARSIGAAATVNTADTDLRSALRQLTPASAVIEATGVPSLLRTAIEVVAPSGVVVVVGISTDEICVPVSEFTRKEISVLGSRNSAGEFSAAVSLAKRHRRPLAGWVTHRFGMDSVGEALRFAQSHPRQMGKTVIDVAGVPT